MAWNEHYYDQLIFKIDQFTRKYYVNQLIRGSLYFIGLLTVVFLIYNMLENQFYFNKTIRSILSFSYLGLFLICGWLWVARPLMHYFKLGTLISHDEAARIIGTHFSDVKDKLLNVLQLKSQSVNFTDRSLIEASIEQKSMELHPVPFIAAIDYNKNKKYIHYAFAPLLILASLLVFAPGMIQKPTQRLIQIDKEFEKEAAFKFIIDNSSLSVEQNGDFTLRVRTEGKLIPAEAFIMQDHFQYRLQKDGPEEFSYNFKNIQQNTTFHLFAGDVESREYTLEVLMKPLVETFEVFLDYPAYTGRKDETLSNLGDLLIPSGTIVHWTFHTSYTDQLSFKSEADEKLVVIDHHEENGFRHKKKFMRNESYTLYLRNNKIDHPDSIQYQVSIIEDQYPQIEIEQFADSTDWRINYFSGTASDDYGLRNISFNYTVIDDKGVAKPMQTLAVRSSETGKRIGFKYVFNALDFNLKPGERISYYFEVWDNDGVNGSKSARSQILQYKESTLEELAKEEASNNQDIKDNLEDALKDAKRLQEKIDEFKNKMRQKKDLEWQNKKDLEKMMAEQNRIQEKLEEARKKFEENLKKQQLEDEHLNNKQEHLKNLFNETASPEMKQLMNQIQDLMNELNKDQAIQMSDQFQEQNTDMTKEMERLLQLFKQLELEKNIKDQIKELRDLAKKQEDLSEKTDKADEKSEDLAKQQEELNKKMEDISKKQEEMQKKNEELQSPRQMEDRKNQTEDIKQDMKDSKNELSKSGASKENKNKASKKQKDASKKMEKMANQMEQEMEESDKEQAEEDARMLRQLLENLVALSFDQERVVDELGNLNVQTPKYLSLVQDQYKIKENFKIVEDTLEVLSKRIVDIQSFVIEKVKEINDNFSAGMKQLEDRRSAEASNNQRRVMKSMNDLALMLAESLDNKQKECKGGSCKKPGSKSCQNPGASGSGKSGKKPADKISEGAKGLEKGMEELLEKMRSGKQGSSKEFAEMAAKQAKLRKMLQDLEQERKESGNGSKEAQEAIDEMNKLEKQLVNKQMNGEMLKRAQEITSRLLESERAEREREWDERRKSETGTNVDRKFPPGLEEYIKQRQGETQWFKQASPELKPFYKELVEQYYQNMRQKG